ncbi:MAG: LPS export ABC transporter permease LptG [Comamonadaceae bacterium SCN 68-20]|jgi:lipopolysaccharide export system permease protein|nr:MAG: LPS export ABC transporter permease LptG [Comamonadaceae bacterium SCN 68-20]OJX27756.1 MAG: LPS export ABC transporter permease LptG [Burkholderiales bacterium 68-20]
MKILRRLIYREASLAVAYVTVAFLALFFFFDMIDELRWVSREPGGYQLSHALLTVVLRLPNYLYELLPITVLIGTIYVMASLAQTSEFTIMRTSGMGPGRALRTLLVLGCAFVALTFAMGDYVAPMADRAGQMLKARYLGQLTTGATGGWLKERKDDGHSLAVNVRALGPDGQMIGIRIFDFDDQGRLSAQIQAASAQVAEDGSGWVLAQAQQRRFVLRGADQAHVEQTDAASMPWPTGITAEMVSAALLKPERMPTIELFQYISHLQANGQSAQKYQIEFWRKVFYPLSCLVMVVLALPFAYLHFRSGGLAAYVFGGVMAGISFFLLNTVFGYAGTLQNWSPWLTAAAPGLIYTAASLAAFGWLVLRR